MKKNLLLIIYILLSLTLRSQSWRTDADYYVINQLFVNDIRYVDIHTFSEMLTSSDTIVLTDGTVIQVPYNNCYGYFIDLLPLANWSHSCKICFVNSSMGHIMVSADLPPVNNDMVLISPHYHMNPNPTPVLFDTTFVRNCKSTDTSHKWAVLICGCGTEPRFWFDLSSVYTVLTDVYSYQEASEGSSTFGLEDRRVIATAPYLLKKRFIPYNDIGSSALNETNPYGVGDFFNWDDDVENTRHSKQNIHNIFKCFAGDEQCLQNYREQGLKELTEEDQLFIYITGHGFTESDDDPTSFFYVQEGQANNYFNCPKIYDDTLVSWLRNIKCSQMTLVMQNCYSGGFVEKFMNDISNPNCLCKNRIGQSATSADGVSYAENYGVYLESLFGINNSSFANEFTYYWASAALGYYPYYKTKENYYGFQVIDKGPWTANNRIIGSGNMNWGDYFGSYELCHPHLPQYDIDPDADGDMILSCNELFGFANNLDSWSRQGYYYPNHNDTIGDQFWPLFQPEFPQQQYESSFTREAATLSGYEGQINGITNSGTATQPYRLCGNIYIGSDAELTMRDKVQSPENVTIIVKPSGKLFLDGATLTNLPETQSPMWSGIEVWGNNSTHQQESHGHYLQGYLEMRNGAVIENAKCAVELWRPGYYSTTGGIIHATDATFRNNAKAVHALCYTYSPSGGTSGYNGYLHNCTLAIDEDYLGTEIFYKHVDLAHIGEFGIEGCSFSTMRNITGVSPYCVGIGAYSAGFKVISYCDLPSGSNMTVCPEEHLVPSSFTNFYQGIHASNDGSSASAFRIDNSVFYNNTFGIYALNIGYGTILNNDFIVGCGSDCDFGIYADGVSTFCIEDNAFHPKATNLGTPYGIVVVNSEGTNDIYRNNFNNLYCGNVAIGDNTIAGIFYSQTTQGLTYTCNTNTDNLIDFCVLLDGNTGDIASSQGSTILPAGNTFGGSLYHFYNQGESLVSYYYDVNEPNQKPTLLYRVGAYDIKVSNSCQSHYNGGSISKSASEKEALASDYLLARTTYNNLLQLYESSIDGGSTPTQVANINNSVPSDMWKLRTQLLGLSPYVSGEVLTTAADRYDVFTDPVLFEILAANPDELKKDSLISYLENKEHPLPAYMIEMLRQLASGFTARTALQAQMSHYGHAYRLAAGDIVRSCLNDSITDLAELRIWLANMNDLASDRMIVASFLQEGDSIHAFALANMLPELYGLHGDAIVDHADYMSLLGLYQTLNRENRTVYELTDAEIVMVNDIATSGTGTSKVMAEALLMERSGESFLSSYCPVIPIYYGRFRGWSDTEDVSTTEAIGFAVSVSPNPATTWATVKYTLPLDAPKASLSLINALGVTVATYELTGNESQKVLDLRGLANGVYTYAVRCGKYSQTGKIIITK